MAGKSRILYIEHRAGVGGGQVCLLELLKRLDRSRFDPLVTCVSRGELYDRLLELGVDIEILDIRGVLRHNPVSTLAVVGRLSRLAREGGIDMVHANSQKALLYSARAPGLRGVPAIWHCHVPSDFGRILDVVARLRAGMIIANSEYVSRRFRWPVPAGGKVRIIPNGIDTETFEPGREGKNARAELGIGHEDIVVGAVGRLVEEKGIEYFLRAASAIGAKIPEVRFMVVGESPPGGRAYREKLVRIAGEVPAPSSVVFAGFRSDVADFIAAMDIVVVPSLREGFGLVVGESMAMGKPVVCSDVGGIPELVSAGETGVLVPPGDADAIATEVLCLIRDREKASGLGRAARSRIVEKFGMGRHVKLIEDAYAEMLGD
jgi:glycosyltransferase involved in cell wall biosynthesis